MSTQHWTATPERSNMLMLRIMTWISLRMGRRAGRVILHLIAAYFLIFSPSSRRASLTYLTRALNRKANWRDMYRHFYSFASTIHDRIYLINQRFDLFDIQVSGQACIDEAIQSGTGVFLVGAHFGSFEVMHAMGRSIPNLHVSMVMHENNAMKINAMLAAINPEAAADIIGLGHIDTMLKVRERLEQGAMVGILADRTLGEDATQPVSLLGHTAHLPTGPFRMAALLRQRMVFMTGVYLGANRYQISFEPLADFTDIPTGQRGTLVNAAVMRYAALIEQHCRNAPYNWFNFFDFWQQPHTATTENT
ncbi:acyl-CoA synthetase [Sulfuriferula nivalis]|uniref:Acyltransferase n=1 Tax=Sulfuriferula nivalis TaxID=2675298 RepID=A0A809RU22_9PROT|nr:acyl-CoA synthetase [Sulfuriferula nivalis]BBP02411.1 acyltransferase [Sulfuriferula nivalis]